MPTTHTKNSGHTKTSAYGGEDPDPLSRINEIVDGRYRLLEFIGQGGMGNIYRGEHKTIRKPLALKLLHPSLAGIAEIRSRFEREAFAIGRIGHPNCVEVYDFGELNDGSLFLVMELLEGESAAELISREQGLSPVRALRLIRYVLMGLAHVHHVGIVHRDVKPENIFIIRSETDPEFAKLIDFGIAKLIDGTAAALKPAQDEKLTQAGITFGTPCYLSPEQALGEPADYRSDLYSVGVVMFELLTGSPPFAAADNIELLAMHTTRPPPRLATIAPSRTFSDDLEKLVARSLSKRREDRFTDAAEFIQAIDALGVFKRPPSFSGTLDLDAVIGELAASTRTMKDAESPSAKSESPTKFESPSAKSESPAKFESPSAKSESPASTVSIRWFVLAAITALAVVGAAVILLTNRVPLVPSSKPAPSAIALKADLAMAQGDPAEAIEVVEKASSSSTDASAQLQLGHAHASIADYASASAAYKRALRLDRSSIRDAQMVANLRLMVDRSGTIYFDALESLVKYAKDPKAINRLIELASSNKPELRKHAFRLAEDLGFGDRIDRVKSFIFDLEQLPECKDRREAVAKLRALGDKRAIKPLRIAFNRRRQGRRGNLNKCLIREARDAVRFLESKPATPLDSE